MVLMFLDIVLGISGKPYFDKGFSSLFYGMFMERIFFLCSNKFESM